VVPSPAPRPPTWGVAALLGGIALRLLVSGRIYPLSNPLFLLFFAGLLLLRLPGRGQGLWVPKPLEFFLFLFLGAAGISIPLGLLPRAGWNEMITLLGHLFMVLAVIRWLTPDLGRSAAVVLVWAGLLSSAVALRQYFGGFAATLEIARPLDPYVVQTLEERRVFGLTFSPDLFAGDMAMLIPLALALAGDLRRRIESLSPWRMALLLVPAAAMALALFFTRSLGGLLAAGVGLLILFAPAFPRLSPRTRRAGLALLALVFIAGLAWIGITRGREFFNFLHPANPIKLRLDNWRAASEVALEKPLTGVGLGNFGLAYMAHRSTFGNEVQDAHNCYLQVWAETGPLGLIGWIGLALLFLVQGRRQSREGGWLPAGLLAAGAAFLSHSLIDFDLYVPEVAGAWWAVLGLQAVLAGKPDPAPNRSFRFARAALAVIIVWTMAGAAWLVWDLRLIRRAEEAMADGKFKQALAAWDQVKRFDPHNDGIYARLAQARAGAGPLDAKTKGQIIQDYRLAQALNPRNPFYHRDLADFYRSHGQLKGAEKEYRQAIALYPNSYALNLELGRVLMAEKKWPEAKKVLRHAEPCSPFNSEAVLALAEILTAAGRPEEAEQLLEGHVRERPQIIQSWQALADFRFGRKEWDRARAAYAEMVKRWPSRREGYLGLALVAAHQGERERALFYLQELLRRYPQDPEAGRLYRLLSASQGPSPQNR